MLFNSISFLIFLPIIFSIYWIVNKRELQFQNILLLMSSYFFYAFWNWHFLFLLIFSTALDYFSGIEMHKSKNKIKKKIWFWTSISINLGFLGIFKYYNFFADSFSNALEKVGFHVSFYTLKVILPVGISFYTFHGLSYVIDIYKNRIEPERNIITYSLFVSYFPLLVAGPIERATHLLPQIKKKRVFNYGIAIQGVKQIIWGLFKKVVIADNCAFFVNQIFENSGSHSATELWIGMFLFSFQIYGDFSGYSDIALGTSKLFGIDLLRNFNFPYFSKDIADFWRRWHISLSTWFRDYVYIPLGGSQGSKLFQIRNVFIIFLLSGFWHGANWTYIFWGLIHALLFIPLLIFNKNRNSLQDLEYNFKGYLKIITTFIVVSFAWIFFRANSITEAFNYCICMFNFSDLTPNYFYKNAKYALLTTICVISILFLIFIEWKNVTKGNKEIQLSKSTLFIILLLLFCMGTYRNQMSFIYFQF
ncbi:MBOAT family O-acyltransferase [Flavobacterium sp. SUN052]|uniref:MBOAT family O-acyltransferase n=1 Tax=Flavobacterium sp. SUN052 TaxID=3002441 RepID=UPI00237EAB6B|nr:MBOAT family O-acyltransferase [Flavobacterium sp. SUN052]MEC4004398.1 MBOAT family O-acyltransferase [Flavobacterium sp. SUN052]